jgi:hypothetical protein
MKGAISPLLESGLLSSEAKAELTEAWDEKVAEVTEQVRAELRSEFARRYEHDKSVMAEALEKMVEESLTSEIAEIRNEGLRLADDRAKFAESMKSKAQAFEKFMTETLAKEIKELHEDRKEKQKHLALLESYVETMLAEEINEFAADKKSLVETKVRLIAESKAELNKLKKSFVERSSKLVKESVSTQLATELTQLKEDIKAARENNFGRKIFESFAAEFGSSYLNENQEIKKLLGRIKARDIALAESREQTQALQQLAESTKKQLNKLNESVTRSKKLSKLTRSLNKEKAAVMESLLENVAIDKLDSAFEKYLPAVLNESKTVAQDRSRFKQPLHENKKEVTGNKKLPPRPMTRATSSKLNVWQV